MVGWGSVLVLLCVAVGLLCWFTAAVFVLGAAKSTAAAMAVASAAAAAMIAACMACITLVSVLLAASIGPAHKAAQTTKSQGQPPAQARGMSGQSLRSPLIKVAHVGAACTAQSTTSCDHLYSYQGCTWKLPTAHHTTILTTQTLEHPALLRYPLHHPVGKRMSNPLIPTRPTFPVPAAPASVTLLLPARPPTFSQPT